MVKRIPFLFAQVFLILFLAGCSGSEFQTTAAPAAADQSQNPASSPNPLPASGDVSLVFGVKSVLYSMSDYDAGKQNLPLNKYISQHTDIFSYSMDQHTKNVIFSDKDLPVFILNKSGGGETALHDIVAVDPSSGKLYARMMPRDQYTDYMDAGSLYELSSDGTNTYTKLFDFDHPDDFALSPDAARIASLSDNDLVIRTLPDGNETQRLSLKDFKDNWIPKISWSPDGNSILVDVAAGDASVTPEKPYSQTVGCHEVNLLDGSIRKLTAAIFQSPRELRPGFMTDPSGYAFFPRSNRLIGMARKYTGGNYYVEMYSVSLDGSALKEIPIGKNASVWTVFISPDEHYLAYPCMLDICVSDQNGSNAMIANPAPTPQSSEELEQTIIGWLER